MASRAVYNTCDFRFAKMLVGVPPNPPGTSGHCGPVDKAANI